MGSHEVTQPSRVVVPPTATPERYVLVERLGEGAMGVVWRARDTQLDRDVALKVLHDHFGGSDHQAQLAREARMMARLAHPNVVTVYDAGEREGRAFVAMELVRGEPLTTWLEVDRPWHDVVAVFRQLADGLAAAHAAGVLHRDVKPSNILIDEQGRPRLVDFGVAHASSKQLLDPQAPLTASTTGLIGSPAYMSIERLCGEPAEASGDQFGFCVALYEALHGQRPFDAPTIAGTIAAITRGVPPPTRDVPRWLHAVIVRGLAIKPADRFPSMTALGAALAGPRRRWGRATAAAGIGVAAVVVAAAIAWPRADTNLAAADPSLAPDAAVLAVTAPSDAASLEALGTDAAPVADAAIAEAAPADATSRRTPARRPAPSAPPAPLSKADRFARMMELRAQWEAAYAAKNFRESRRIAELAMRLAPEDPDPKALVITSSCHLGDARRAREMMARFPRGQTMNRIAAAQVCRRVGINLDDLLTESEARVAH